MIIMFRPIYLSDEEEIAEETLENLSNNKGD